MNPRLERLTQTKRLAATKITQGSEKRRSELQKLLKEGHLNAHAAARLLGVSHSCVGAWLKRDRKCPALLTPAIAFIRIQMGLPTELDPTSLQGKGRRTGASSLAKFLLKTPRQRHIAYHNFFPGAKP